MALPTTGTAMAWLTVVTTVLMLTPMELTDTTTARGLLRLRLSPPPLLSPLLMPTMAVTDMAWPITHTVMAWLTTVLTTVLTLTLYAYGHYYGKRSPEADAYYGHHYGYGLAHHGYGYAHHGYYGYPYA